MNAHTRIPTDIEHLSPALQPLIAERRWVVWKWESTRKGKMTKMPYKPARPTDKASNNKPETWSDYQTACDVVAAGQADGIGFNLFDSDIAAFDLDNCVAEDGTIATWAWNLIDECDSYTERTPSGTGLRIIGTADGDLVHKAQAVPDTKSHLETYRKAIRFITVTGNPIDGFADALRNIDKPIDAWVARLDGGKAQPGLNATKQREEEKPSTEPPKDIPPELAYTIQFGSEGDRSAEFHHCIGWLRDLGYRIDAIEEILNKYPDGIAAKYKGRLRKEIERCYYKVKDKRAEEPKGATPPSGPRLAFYGDTAPEPPPWLIRNVLPQKQVAVLAGQHSAGKTFIAVDAAYSVMTGEPFIDNAVERQGGVLWLAAEGASEIAVRLKAAAIHRSGKDQAGELPFAYQLADVPSLTEADVLPKLMALVDEFKAGLATRFPGTDLALIVIDTLNSAAGFADENSASETQRVFNTLRKFADASGALVLVVDHYGKMTETGIRGSSAKSGAADAILAAIAEKNEVTGKVLNRRMTVTKLRGAATGAMALFTLKPVPVDPWGNTHCGIEWTASASDPTPAAKPGKPAWSGTTKLLKACIERMLIEHGSDQRPFGMSGPRVKAVPVAKVREEFVRSYAAEDAAAKRMAFKRAVDTAKERDLIATYEIGASLQDWVWFVMIPDPERNTTSP